MALKDSWQQQRQLRLQQVAQRRQAVSTLLQETHEQRQIKASQLRSDLSLFRETLAYDANDRRKNLHQFCETLQAQTQEFLAIAQAERGLISQQLRQDLRTFRSALEQTVKSLQQEIQADLQILQIETQTQLDEAHQLRAKNHIRLSRNLRIFVENLRSTVDRFLADAALEQQEKADSDQAKRKAALEKLFQEFAEFRSQLAQYRSELSQTVWGEGMAQTIEQKAELKAEPKTVQKIELKAEPKIEITQPEPVAKPEIEQPALNSDEQKIYGYIEDMQSVRLTEIESALSMTRIQAVEGLRSLIQQGKITQRNRMYLISKQS
jgi:hypothetical protein